MKSKMILRREDVIYIARLARLGIDEADIDKFQVQLSNILENFEILQQVDTTDVRPTAHTLALQDVMSDDKVIDSLSPTQILANAPNKKGQFFRIRAVLD